jgi:uncharacterized protein YcnI
MRTIITPLLAVVAALAIVAPASAHVTAQPPEQPAGGFTVVSIRVPNERPEATEKVEVQFPEGITSVRTKPVDGWTADIKMEKLDEPIDDGHGGKVTEQVDTVTFSGGSIKDGEFQEFPLSFKLPEKGELGDLLFFPAIQTYVGGEEVAWTEKPASEHDDAELERPAPSVTLVAGGDDHHAAASSDDAKDDKGGDDAKDDDGDDVSEGRDNAAFGLALAAFVISLLVMFRTTMGRKKQD